MNQAAPAHRCKKARKSFCSCMDYMGIRKKEKPVEIKANAQENWANFLFCTPRHFPQILAFL